MLAIPASTPSRLSRLFSSTPGARFKRSRVGVAADVGPVPDSAFASQPSIPPRGVLSSDLQVLAEERPVALPGVTMFCLPAPGSRDQSPQCRARVVHERVTPAPIALLEGARAHLALVITASATPVMAESRAAATLEEILLDQDTLGAVLVYLQLPDIVSLTRVNRRLFEGMSARRHLWAGLARQWALPIQPHTATLARVAAVLRVTQLQAVAIKHVHFGDFGGTPPAIDRVGLMCGGKGWPKNQRQLYQQVAINVGCVAFSSVPVVCAQPQVPVRLPFAVFNMRCSDPGHQVFLRPEVAKTLSAFDKTVNWRTVRGWTLDEASSTIVIVYRRAHGRVDGVVTLYDDVVQLRLLTRLFRVYTDLALCWRRNEHLLTA